MSKEEERRGEERRGGERGVETYRYWIVFMLQKFWGICPEMVLLSKTL